MQHAKPYQLSAQQMELDVFLQQPVQHTHHKHCAQETWQQQELNHAHGQPVVLQEIVQIKFAQTPQQHIQHKHNVLDGLLDA